MVNDIFVVVTLTRRRLTHTQESLPLLGMLGFRELGIRESHARALIAACATKLESEETGAASWESAGDAAPHVVDFVTRFVAGAGGAEGGREAGGNGVGGAGGGGTSWDTGGAGGGSELFRRPGGGEGGGGGRGGRGEGQQRRPLRRLPDDDTPLSGIKDALFDTSPAPDQITDQQALRQDLRSVLDQLPQLERDVISLRYGLDGGTPKT